MKILIRILMLALALMALPKFIPGFHVSGFFYAFAAAIALGLVNLLIKPVIKFVTLPVNMLTLGLFGLVVNGLLLWAVASFVPGFTIDSFKAAFIGALALALISWIASKI